MDKTNNEFKETKKLFRNKIKSLKIKLGLTNEIINQTENYNNKRHEYLESKINILINSFKVLYIRKLSNLLLERLINKYKENFAVTEKIFGGKIKFGVVVVNKDIKK